MPILAQRKNTKTEELILTGMIVSDEFFSGIRSVVKTDYFANTYTSRVAEWCIDYYNSNGSVPFENIFHIFEAEKDSLPREDIQVLSALFTRIGEVYDTGDNFNHQYLLHSVTIPYFEKREVEIRAQKALGYLQKDDVESAKNILNDPIRLRESAIHIVNPFEPEYVEDSIFTIEEPLFQLQGALGRLLGPIQEGWLINLQGAMKRGKSNFLYDIAFLLAASNIKVYHVSLEMKRRDSVLKWAKRMTGCSTEAGTKIYPCFDCVKNQAATCDKIQRPDQPALLSEKGKKPKYDIDHPHIPCTACRADNDYYTDFEPATWFQPVLKSYIGTNYNLKLLETFNRYYGHNIRSVTYPKFSVSFQDIVRDMDVYTQDTGWIPKVFIIDYLDVTRLPKSSNGRDSYDEVWKRAAGFSDERAITVINVSQPNRGGIIKKSMDETDTSEDIRKMAHVDVWATLNQLPSEKRDKCARIGLVAHRHHDFDKTKQAMILQDIDTGQFVLDSEIVHVESDEEE
jgi:hypothetical protein